MLSKRHVNVRLAAALVTLLPLVIRAGNGHIPKPPRSFNCTSQPKKAYDKLRISNAAGNIVLHAVPYGATATNLLVRDRDGVLRDILLGFDDAGKYCSAAPHTYFGATIGRIANRIKGGTFEFKNKTYHTDLNEPKDTLHGGWSGYDRRTWSVLEHTNSKVLFHYFSIDGDQGFPGNVWINVTYEITERDAWRISISAATDSSTILSMTNHAYFNLNANVNNTATVEKHIVHMPTASRYLEVDSDLLPTGRVLPASNAMNFSQPKSLGRDIDKTPARGYDNAWIFGSSGDKDEDNALVIVSSPLTGIELKMYTDQPSVQMYSGNALNGSLPRKASQCFNNESCYYSHRGAFTLESQAYLDSIHHPNFPSWEVDSKKPYTWTTEYYFGLVL